MDLDRRIRVVIADDHILVRSGIRALIEATAEDIEVVGEASDGQEAFELTKQLSPDVVVMDAVMPVISGTLATRRIMARFPDVRVIVLSMHTDIEYLDEALHAGALGYVVKDAASHELTDAIRSVVEGESYLSPRLSSVLLNAYRDGGRLTSPHHALSVRQREVLELVVGGLTTKQIAEHLHLSVKTVETHRMQLMRRLDVRDLASLVRYALKHNLVKTDG